LSRISGYSPSASARSSINEASLQSITPAWIPFWISTTGFPVSRAASGVKASSLEAISSGISRPCAERP
jgi:hypothetical protein